MVYFRNIRKTKHYIEKHENDVPWHKVVEIIFKSAKKMKKKEDKIEIKIEKYYILCKVEKEILWIINAKKRG